MVLARAKDRSCRVRVRERPVREWLPSDGDESRARLSLSLSNFGLSGSVGGWVRCRRDASSRVGDGGFGRVRGVVYGRLVVDLCEN